MNADTRRPVGSHAADDARAGGVDEAPAPTGLWDFVGEARKAAAEIAPHNPDATLYGILAKEVERLRATREALAEAIAWHIAKNDERYAYDRCGVCGATWWGPREGRTNPERERHNMKCPVPGWRRALPPTAHPSAPQPAEP